MNTNQFEGFDEDEDNGTDMKFEGDDSALIENEFQEDNEEKEFDHSELEGIGPDITDFAGGNQEEDEEEEEDDDENPFEEKEEEEDEEQDIDLKALNKKFGTNFEKEDDLRKYLKQDDAKEEVDQAKLDYKKEKGVIPVYEEWISWDDERLVKETLFSQAAQDGRDTSSNEVMEEIEAQIEALKDSNLLRAQAGPIRMNIKNEKDRSQSVINKYERDQELSAEQQAKENNEQLQNALVSLTKDNFLGITIDKKELGEIYKDIKSKKWFEKINNSQEGIARLALIDRYYDKIAERLGKPTQSDGIAKTMEELGISGSRARGVAAQVLKDTANNKGKSNILNFVK